MAVVTVKVHHPHDGCAKGTAGHSQGNPHDPDGGKMEKTMHEFKHGTLHSGSKHGPKVTSRKQAIAIGMSQARKAGEA
jgi:hypothetical protein